MEKVKIIFIIVFYALAITFWIVMFITNKKIYKKQKEYWELQIKELNNQIKFNKSMQKKREEIIKDEKEKTKEN